MIGNTFNLIVIGQKMLILAGILIFIFVFSLIVQKNRKTLKYFIAFAMLVQVIYMAWRLLFTIPTQNAAGFVFGMLLFLAELIALLQSTTYRVMFLKDYKQETKTLNNLKVMPTVDILITTYNEPVELLRNTVAAAVNQKYPKDKFTVFICDDGRRKEVRQLAREYGAVWAVREDHIHAKAGNLNNCLKHYASGELFVVLDADMIPKTTFLERTVGYFADPNMALVQAPQVFYNPDPFQNNLQLYDAIPNEQDFFMREVLTRRGMFNAVLNVGSNAVFRRSAIEAIGWIPVGTITEDMATSMLLQAKGYSTIFVNENLAMGLSPDTFSDYVVQRDRWCRGNIQVLKKWNPLTLPGLSFMQRLIYFDGVLYWFFGLQKIIYIIGPILFLLTSIPVFYADVFTMLLFFVPTYFISSLIFSLFNHKSRTYIWAHIYETALAPYLFISALSELFLSKKVKFSVTPKGGDPNKSHFALRVAMPHLVIAAISLIALGFGIHKMLTDVNYMIPVYLVNLFWLLYNLMGVIAAIFVCFEKQRFRAAERFAVQGQMILTLNNGQAIPVKLIDISMRGCAVSPLVFLENADQFVGSDAKLAYGKDFELPGIFFRSRSWGKRLVINFKKLSIEQNTHLLNFIFDQQQSGYGKFNQESIHFGNALREIITKWWKKVFQFSSNRIHGKKLAWDETTRLVSLADKEEDNEGMDMSAQIKKPLTSQDLKLLKKKVKTAIVDFKEAIQSENEDDRVDAIHAIDHDSGPWLYPALVDLINDDSQHVRAEACHTLSFLQYSQALPFLEKAATDPDWTVRSNAARAIGKLGDLGEHVLLKMVKGNDPFAHDAAQAVLEHQGFLEHNIQKLSSSKKVEVKKAIMFLLIMEEYGQSRLAQAALESFIKETDNSNRTVVIR